MKYSQILHQKKHIAQRPTLPPLIPLRPSDTLRESQGGKLPPLGKGRVGEGYSGVLVQDVSSKIGPLVTGLVSAGLVITAIALLPQSAHAQSGNQSDVSGNIVTTSDIAGSLFQNQVSGEGNGDNAQFQSPAVADAVTRVLGEVITRLQAGQLPPPNSGQVTVEGFQAAQDAIAHLTPLATVDPALQQSLATATTLAEFQTLLGAAGFPERDIDRLSQALERLQQFLAAAGRDSSWPRVMDVAIDIATVVHRQDISPAQLQTALAAYNSLVKNASLAFLENPPAEFHVLHKALESLIQAALGAQSSNELAGESGLTEGEEAALLAAFSPGFRSIEQSITDTFASYFGWSNATIISLATVRDRLAEIEQLTGQKPAASYITFTSPNSKIAGHPLTKSLPPDSPFQQTQTSQEPVLQIMLVTPSGDRMIQHTVEGVTKQKLFEEIRAFRTAILSPAGRTRDFYLDPAQQLYDWLIRPIEAELTAQEIDTLVFATDIGLRFIPLAALHDGNQFLVENYSVALMPSFSLTDAAYTDLRQDQVLAMGASEFSNQPPLPAASVELSTIAQTLWQGETFINEDFTLDNFTRQSQSDRFRIVHLATHAAFQPGPPRQSYIQLWDTRLGLDQMAQFNWGDTPTVDLLVLSACQTAVGSREAELGFAGLAVQSGAKSALASIWSVTDSGTLGLMTEFYQQLRQQPIKAEALRQAQLAMLNGSVRFEDNQLRWTDGTTELPDSLKGRDRNLSHPYYWSGFTMIGSAW